MMCVVKDYSTHTLFIIQCRIWIEYIKQHINTVGYLIFALLKFDYRNEKTTEKYTKTHTDTLSNTQTQVLYCNKFSILENIDLHFNN